jgi:hypothetical protein
VPEEFVNRILPLSISPVPAQTARVFVGRLELVTPATEKAVESAFAAHDRATLEKYRRFLEPILQTMIAKEAQPSLARKFSEYLNSVYSAQIEQLRNQK